MLTAKQIMTPDPVTVTPDTDITEAAKLMLDRKFNGLPVVDEAGELVGILCQSDLVAQQKQLAVPSLFTFLDGFIPMSSLSAMEREIEKMSATKVAQAMTPDPVTVTAEDALDRVATLMVEKKLHTVPVVQDGALVGVIGKEDILRTLVPGAENA